MASPTYLMRRNGIYYARIPVPTGMQEEVGRKEIWKSLGNRNYKESCKLLKTVLLSDALFMIPNNEKTEVLSNKAAMVAIGEPTHPPQHQRGSDWRMRSVQPHILG